MFTIVSKLALFYYPCLGCFPMNYCRWHFVSWGYMSLYLLFGLKNRANAKFVLWRDFQYIDQKNGHSISHHHPISDLVKLLVIMQSMVLFRFYTKFKRIIWNISCIKTRFRRTDFPVNLLPLEGNSVVPNDVRKLFFRKRLAAYFTNNSFNTRQRGRWGWMNSTI